MQVGRAEKGEGSCVLRAQEGCSKTAFGSSEERKGGRKDKGAIGGLRILGAHGRAACAISRSQLHCGLRVEAEPHSGKRSGNLLTSKCLWNSMECEDPS